MTAGNRHNQQIVDEFRAGGGKDGGYFAGAAIVLPTTTDAGRGKQTVSPVVVTKDGDRLLIYASPAGAPNNPARAPGPFRR